MFAASDFSEPGHASPRAAAFAGLIFSVLLIVGLVIDRLPAQAIAAGHLRSPGSEPTTSPGI
jgi:hypothetical protein